MLTLQQLQTEAAAWRAHNFPNYEPWEQLLGMQEELGEISHAYLKHYQGIRNIDGETALVKIADGVGDLIIFASGLCSALGLNLERCVENAWNEVKERDWQASPDTGERYSG